VHDAEEVRFLDRDPADRHRGFGLVAQVEVDQPREVHLVDMVAGEHDHEVGFIPADVAEVLVDRVRRAPIPVAAAHPLVGRKDADLARAPDQAPGLAVADVVGERIGEVLGQDADALDAGVHDRAQGEVDQPVDPAEGDGRLGPVPDQDVEAAPHAAGQDHGERAAGVQCRPVRLEGRVQAGRVVCWRRHP